MLPRPLLFHLTGIPALFIACDQVSSYFQFWKTIRELLKLATNQCSHQIFRSSLNSIEREADFKAIIYVRLNVRVKYPKLLIIRILKTRNYRLHGRVYVTLV